MYPDDRHRVKLHPLLGDPNSDYINANYIDVSLILLSCCVRFRFIQPPLSHPAKNRGPSLSHKPPLCCPASTLESLSNPTTVPAVLSQMPSLSGAAADPWPPPPLLSFLLKQRGTNAFNFCRGDEPFCKTPQCKSLWNYIDVTDVFQSPFEVVGDDPFNSYVENHSKIHVLLMSFMCVLIHKKFKVRLGEPISHKLNISLGIQDIKDMLLQVEVCSLLPPVKYPS